MKILAPLAALALLGASSCCSGGGGTGGSGSSGGSAGGTSGGAAWDIVALDASPDAGSALDDLALAVGPGDVVGVAYLQDSLQASDAGDDWYDVRYVQWAAGTAGQPQEIDRVHADDLFGIALAFAPGGTPSVAYLGGAPYGGAQGASHFWYESSAMVATQAGGSWTAQPADDGLNDPDGPTQMGPSGSCSASSCPAQGCCSPYPGTGPSVVGLYSALGFDSHGTAYDYFRDIGTGECDSGSATPCGASRIDGEVGGPGDWTLEWAFLGNTWQNDGVTVNGLGAHLHLVMANDVPALVTDDFGDGPGAQSGGQNVDFLTRLGPNHWSVPQQIISAGDTQAGPSLAWDPTYGYAVAVQNLELHQLLFTSSPDGVTWPAQPSDLAGDSGGWYPSVAISPVTHQPSIADLFCSTQPGASALAQCPADERFLELRSLQGASWAAPVTVDPAGGFLPKLGFLSTGKRVVAYRQLYGQGKVGALVLAVEH
ncbi:MAG TPA: hypothetical protein VMB50_02085 [Myxococcales bacterium]|nr:hypothetical protein [Myxococcales bacterium]